MPLKKRTGNALLGVLFLLVLLAAGLLAAPEYVGLLTHYLTHLFGA